MAPPFTTEGLGVGIQEKHTLVAPGLRQVIGSRLDFGSWP